MEMEMQWIQLKATGKTEDLEIISAVMSMVSSSLMIEDYSDVAEGVNAIYGELLDKELINKDKSRAAVSVYISQERNLSEIMSAVKQLIENSGVKTEISTSGLSEKDWAECWKKYYKPIEIGEKLVIVPMWEEYTPGPGKVTVKMDPGMAFGTGTHETTALCAEMIEKHLPENARVLDV